MRRLRHGDTWVDQDPGGDLEFFVRAAEARSKLTTLYPDAKP